MRSAGHLALVHSGIGPMQRGGWPRGSLDLRLREVGVDPNEVDLILNTHMHADHVGWQTVGSGRSVRPFFPNARCVFQAREWRYWLDSDRLDAVGNEHLADCVASLAGRVDIQLVEGAEAVTPELGYVPTPGYTPGHAVVEVTSMVQRCFVIGDASHYAARLRPP